MAKKKKQAASGGGSPEWMCTFGDMMSLLLCFFVLLFSLSTIEITKFYQAIGSIQGALGKVPNLFNTSYVKPISVTPQKSEPVQQNRTINRAKDAIAKRGRSKLVSHEKSKEIIVEGVFEGIRYSVSGRIMFELGSAQLTDEGKSILDIIATELADFPTNRVRIEGHADSNPVPSTSPFRDNWRLAQARAFTTLKHLRDNVQPPESSVAESRLSFMSCSDKRPRFPNDTLENRALNRRIEIVLLQGRYSEPFTGILDVPKERKQTPDPDDFLPNSMNTSSGNS